MEYNTITTNDDYKRIIGIDLDTELVASVYNDIGDNPAPRFISYVEEWCKEYLEVNYAFNGNVSVLQRERFVKGVCYQIQYILQNGEVANDIAKISSIMDARFLDKISMCDNALRCFKSRGMANVRAY